MANQNATTAARRVYTIRYEDGETERLGRGTLAQARAHARRTLRENMGGQDETQWYDATILDAKGEEVAEITVTVHPAEPRCKTGDDSHDSHDWQDDGAEGFGDVVTGHGGGVILQHRCATCGVVRVTDTWAQRRDTGEQGLESISYRAGDDDESAS